MLTPLGMVYLPAKRMKSCLRISSMEMRLRGSFYRILRRRSVACGLTALGSVKSECLIFS